MSWGELRRVEPRWAETSRDEPSWAGPGRAPAPHLKHFHFVYTKNTFGPSEIINYPGRGPELGSSIWWKSHLSSGGQRRRLGLWKKSGPEMGSAVPKWPKWHRKGPKRRSTDSADSIVKPMETSLSHDKGHREWTELVPTPYKTCLFLYSGRNVDTEWHRFYCKTNGNCQFLEKGILILSDSILKPMENEDSE